MCAVCCAQGCCAYVHGSIRFRRQDIAGWLTMRPTSTGVPGIAALCGCNTNECKNETECKQKHHPTETHLLRILKVEGKGEIIVSHQFSARCV